MPEPFFMKLSLEHVLGEFLFELNVDPKAI